MYLRPWISKHAWANSITASWSRSKLKNLESQTNGESPRGNHTHINSGMHLLPHFWPLIFTPYISEKPLFLQKIVTQSPLFSPHCPKFWNFFTQDPKSTGIWLKGTQMPSIFMAFVTERPLDIFALHARVWEECCSLKQGQKLENFVFLKQNRAICRILLGANLIKVMKTNFQFYRLNRPNCTLWTNFIGGQGWYTGHHPSDQTWKGVYPTTTLYMILHILAL